MGRRFESGLRHHRHLNKCWCGRFLRHERVMRRILYFLFLSCVLALSAFGQSLRPGQRLRFRCPAEPLLDVSRTIGPDGAVILPLLGPVGAAGKTLERIQGNVTDMLKERGRFLLIGVSLAYDPDAPISFHGALDLTGSLPPRPAKTLEDILSAAHPSSLADLHAITITDALGRATTVDGSSAPKEIGIRPGDDISVPVSLVSDEAMVLGGVQKPGSVTLKPGLTIGQAIDVAGGLSGHGDVHQITLEHAGQTAPATLESILQKGDVVRVGLTLDRKFVAVKGAVERQGVVEWHKGMLLSEIIKEAGGESKGADIVHVQVRRFANGKVVKFDLVRIRKQLDKDPEIEANDTVIVAGGGRG